jgi:hypothetical protein
MHYYHLRPLTKTFGHKRFEHSGQIAVGGRLSVDNTRIRRPREPAGSATVVPDDPFAGGRRRERRPRTVGAEHHVGPASLRGPHRGRRGGVSVDDLQLPPERSAQRARALAPAFPNLASGPDSGVIRTARAAMPTT